MSTPASDSDAPYVIKRDGTHEPVSYDKIQQRLARLAAANFLPGSPALAVQPVLVADKVIHGGVLGMKTWELDVAAAEVAAYMSAGQPDYGVLAARIAVSNLHKETQDDYLAVVRALAGHETHCRPTPLVQPAFVAIVEAHAPAIQAALDYTRDYALDYFGFKTLQRGYLLHMHGRTVERPQHMYMRVALGIHMLNNEADAPPFDLAAALRTYDLISRHMYTHATPTLFNAGTPHCQLASCFLLPVADDSIVGIFDTLKRCAIISKNAGGIGLSIHNIRAAGSAIAGTNGTSNGIVPMIRQFNDMAKYVDQCFPPGTLVHTAGGMLTMQDLDAAGVYHRVATSAGDFAPIKTVLRHEHVRQSLARITLAGAPGPLVVTQAHPMLVVPACPNPVASLAAGITAARYTDAAQLQVGDWALLPVPQGHADALAPSESAAALAGAAAALSPAGTGVLTDRHALVHLCSLVNAHGEVQMDMEGAPQGVAVRLDGWAHAGLLLDLQAPWPEEAWFHALTGMLAMCAPAATPHCLVCRPSGEPGVRMSLLVATALRAGHAAFVSPNSSSAHVLWSPRLAAWWQQYHWPGDHECPQPELVVRRVSGATVLPLEHPLLEDSAAPPEEPATVSGDLLLLPIEHIQLAPEQPHRDTGSCSRSATPHSLSPQRLYDLEMHATPHDYATQYGLVHNGGGKRPGAVAVYLEPWHADVEDFLMMKREGGKEEVRARDLFYALWIPDLFMRRVFEEEDADWSLFCPNEILPVKLHELTGAEFDAAYRALEAAGKARRTVKAKELWLKVLESQIESGTPYMLYKDAANAKSNQRHLGVIKSSNLCTEIIEYSSEDQVSVCNLSSLALPKYLTFNAAGEATGYDFELFMDVVRTVVRNMNAVIDTSYYPLPEMARSNLAHRPIGLGVQGLADVFFQLRLPYTSEPARDLNRRIFKAMYYAAVQASCELARERGAYASFPGSPASKGLLQPDLWGVDPAAQDADLGLDWERLRADVVAHGLRNSLLVAPMPTASTAQIMGNTECFEAQTSNLFTRRVLSGEFIVVNKYLVRDLTRLGLWSPDMKRELMAANGSVQGLAIPDDMKELYRTVWEMPQRAIVDMAADRGPYICQSQSLNIHFAEATYDKLNGLHYHGWKRGLKTGMYYLRTLAAAAPLQVDMGGKPRAGARASTLGKRGGGKRGAGKPSPKKAKVDAPKPTGFVCSGDSCTMCSS